MHVRCTFLKMPTLWNMNNNHPSVESTALLRGHFLSTNLLGTILKMSYFGKCHLGSNMVSLLTFSEVEESTKLKQLLRIDEKTSNYCMTKKPQNFLFCVVSWYLLCTPINPICNITSKEISLPTCEIIFLALILKSAGWNI